MCGILMISSEYFLNVGLVRTGALLPCEIPRGMCYHVGDLDDGLLWYVVNLRYMENVIHVTTS